MIWRATGGRGGAFKTRNKTATPNHHPKVIHDFQAVGPRRNSHKINAHRHIRKHKAQSTSLHTQNTQQSLTQRRGRLLARQPRLQQNGARINPRHTHTHKTSTYKFDYTQGQVTSPRATRALTSQEGQKTTQKKLPARVLALLHVVKQLLKLSIIKTGDLSVLLQLLAGAISSHISSHL